MKFKFDNNNLLAITSNGEEVVATFIKEEDLKVMPTTTRYIIYAYADLKDNNDLAVKVGLVEKQTVWDRYAPITGHKAHRHMLKLWDSNFTDDSIISKLRIRAKNDRGYSKIEGSRHENDTNSVESFEVNDIRGLNNLMADISEYAIEKAIAKKTRPDYKSIIELVNEIISYNEKFYNLDLCARWGKTGTTLRLCKEYNRLENIRIFIMSAYVGTVKYSYSEEIATLTNNENCLFIDPDNYEDENELVKDIREWLKNKDHYIMYYVALTGDMRTCFNRRVNALKKIKVPTTLVIEEADFGSTCDKQVEKIRHLYKATDCKHVLSMTGTNSDKCENIFNSLDQQFTFIVNL